MLKPEDKGGNEKMKGEQNLGSGLQAFGFHGLWGFTWNMFVLLMLEKNELSLYPLQSKET